MADALVPVRVQLAALRALVATLLVKLTVPVGVMKGPGEFSLTVAVHVVLWPMATVEGEHATNVDVGALALHDKDTPVESAASRFVLMLRTPVLVPDVDGVQDTWTVQLVPLGMPAGAVEQLSDKTLKSPEFVPVMFAGWTTKGPVPVFATVTFSAAVVTPTPAPVKESSVGLTVLA